MENQEITTQQQKENMITYLKSQIKIFSFDQNKSDRMKKYYQDELNKLQNQ